MSVSSNYDKVGKVFSDYGSNGFLADVDKELNRIADIMKEKSSAAAPRDTGYMADHIEKTTTGQGSVTVTAIAEYSGYVDQGTIYMDAQPFFSDSVKYIESTEIPNVERNIQTKIDAKINIRR